jgi:hypothetical protein
MGFGIKERIVGGVVAGGIAIFGGVTATQDKTTRNETGAIVESGGLGAFALRVGDCFMAPEENTELVVSVEGVPCDAPHDGQVYATFDLPDAGSFDAVSAETQADEGCMSRWLNDWWGTYEENHEIDYSFFQPTAESWADADREIACVVVPIEGGPQLVGTDLPA